MRTLLTISIFVLSTFAASAKNPGGDTEPKKAIDCRAFQTAVENRDYQSALAMLTGTTFEACGSVEFVLARAKLKAATFDFKEAEKMLEKLVNENPDNSHVQQSWNHMVRLLDKSGDFTPIDVRPDRGSGSGSNFMIAWMKDTIPQLLTDTLTDPVYFPIKSEGRGVMKFENTEENRNEFLDLITRRLEDRRFEEIGPGVFLPDSSLVITAVKRLPYASAKNAERTALVQFDSKGKFRGELSFGNKMTNAAHPVYRTADSTLIFSSDQKGGYGGMDLWKSKYDGKNWSVAENLGPKVNSSGDEILPTLAGDTLFYSSDKPYYGFGGLDIYAHHFSTGKTTNLGLPVNGPYDEHSFYVTGEGRGIMISNRGESLEESALYKAVWSVPEDFFDELKGKLKDAGDQVGREVHLLNEDGLILQKTVVDEWGGFSFKHIKGEEGYTIAIPDTDLPEGSRLQLYGEDDQLLTETTAQAGGFKFVLLATIDYTLEKMEVEDESLLSADILGMYASENEKGKGMKIMLTDSEGAVIATTFTGDNGRFKFESVRPDERYTIKSEDLEANSLVHIVNERGELISTIDPTGEGEHVYVRLDPDDGVITLTNEHNRRVRISNKDLFDLGVVNYEYNSTDIGREGVIVLAKLAEILEKNPQVRVELEGHTDSRGPDAYNLRLSQERIEAAMDYLELIGIERSRLSGTGYGELRPVNHCENGIECSEAEHAANRRTEFRLADRDE